MMVSFLTLALVSSVLFPVASGVHLEASSPAAITLCIMPSFLLLNVVKMGFALSGLGRRPVCGKWNLNVGDFQYCALLLLRTGVTFLKVT